MTRYWISDLHIGHEKVARTRDLDLLSHDAKVLGPLRKLRSSDEVWILGDLSSSKPDEQKAALRELSKVEAKLHLIAGNHDAVSSTNRNGWKYQRHYLEVFESVQQFGRIRIDGTQVLMSHYPYARAGDGPGRGEARYLEYRLPDEGFLLIHGHTHQPEPHIDGDRSMFCVSQDAHVGLVDEGTITKWVQASKWEYSLRHDQDLQDVYQDEDQALWDARIYGWEPVRRLRGTRDWEIPR